MPRVPQGELTPLRLRANHQIALDPPRGGFPAWLPDPQFRQTDKIMQLTDEDHWFITDTHTLVDYTDWIFWISQTTATVQVDWQVIVDWDANSVFFEALFRPDENSHAYSEDNHVTLADCEKGSPWDTKWQDLTEGRIHQTSYARAFRDVPNLAAQLQILQTTTNPRGILGQHSLITTPIYPEGSTPQTFGPLSRDAAPPATPSETYTYLRLRPTGVITTNPGLLRRQAAAANAAAQWSALTDQQRAAWQRAAAACRQPTAGYNLWFEIFLTRRTDRIRILESRTGQTLAKPTLQP